MKIEETAMAYYNKEELLEETGDYVNTEGDKIYCAIGELLEEMENKEVASKLDMLILEMAEADKKEYFIRGFKAAADAGLLNVDNR